MDKYSYLQPGYNPALLKVAELKRILTTHNVEFAPTAKKQALLTLFKKEITPKSARLLKSLSKKKLSKSSKSKDVEQDQGQQQQPEDEVKKSSSVKKTSSSSSRQNKAQPAAIEESTKLSKSASKNQPILVETSDEELKSDVETKSSQVESSIEPSITPINRKRSSPSLEGDEDNDSELPAPKRALVESATAPTHQVITDENTKQVTYETTDTVIRNQTGEIIEEDSSVQVLISETSTHLESTEEDEININNTIVEETTLVEETTVVQVEEVRELDSQLLALEQVVDSVVEELEEQIEEEIEQIEEEIEEHIGEEQVVSESEPESEAISYRLSNVFSREPESLYPNIQISTPAGNLNFSTEEVADEAIDEIIEEVVSEILQEGLVSEEDEEDDYYKNKPQFILADNLLGRIKQRTHHLFASSLIFAINAVVLSMSFLALFAVILTMGLYVQKLRRVGWCDHGQLQQQHRSNTGFDFSLLGQYDIKLSPLLDRIDANIIPQPGCFKCPIHATCSNEFDQFGEIDYNADNAAVCDIDYVKTYSWLKYYSSHTRTWPFPIFRCIADPQIDLQHQVRMSNYEELRRLVVDELRRINVAEFCDKLNNDCVEGSDEDVGRVEVGELYRRINDLVTEDPAYKHLNSAEFEDNWFSIIDQLAKLPEFDIVTYTSDDNSSGPRRTKTIKSHDLTKIDATCLKLKLVHDLRALNLNSLKVRSIDFWISAKRRIEQLIGSVFLGSVQSSNETNNFDSRSAVMDGTNNIIINNNNNIDDDIVTPTSPLALRALLFLSNLLLSFFSFIKTIVFSLIFGITYPFRLVWHAIAWSFSTVFSLWYRSTLWVLTMYYNFALGIYRGFLWWLLRAWDGLVAIPVYVSAHIVTLAEPIRHFFVDLVWFGVQSALVALGLMLWNHAVWALYGIQHVGYVTVDVVESGLVQSQVVVDEVVDKSKLAVGQTTGFAHRLIRGLVAELVNAVYKTVYDVTYLCGSMVRAFRDLFNAVVYGFGYGFSKIGQSFAFVINSIVYGVGYGFSKLGQSVALVANSIVYGIHYIFGQLTSAVFGVLYGFGYGYSTIIAGIDYLTQQTTLGLKFAFNGLAHGILTIVYGLGYGYSAIIAGIDYLTQQTTLGLKFAFNGLAHGILTIFYGLGYGYTAIIAGIDYLIQQTTLGLKAGFKGILYGAGHFGNSLIAALAYIGSSIVYGIGYVFGQLTSAIWGVIYGIIYGYGCIIAAITVVLNTLTYSLGYLGGIFIQGILSTIAVVVANAVAVYVAVNAAVVAVFGQLVYAVAYSYAKIIGALVDGFNSVLYTIGFVYGNIVAGLVLGFNNFLYSIGFVHGKVVDGFNNFLFGVGFVYGKVLAGLVAGFNNVLYSIGFVYGKIIAGFVYGFNNFLYSIGLVYGKIVSGFNNFLFGVGFVYGKVLAGLVAGFNNVLYSIGFVYGKIIAGFVYGFNNFLYSIGLVYGKIVSGFDQVLYSIGFVYGKLVTGFALGFNQVLYNFGFVYGKIAYVFNQGIYSIGYVYGNFTHVLIAGFNHVVYATGYVYGKFTDSLAASFNAAIYGIGYVYSKFTSGLIAGFNKFTYTVSCAFGVLTQSISNGVTSVIDGVVDVYGRVRSLLGYGVSQVEQVGSQSKHVIENTQDEIKQVIGSTQNEIKQVIGSTQNEIKQAGSYYKQTILSSVNSIENAVKQGGVTVVNIIQTAYKTAVSTCQSIVVGVVRTIYKFNADVLRAIQETVSNIIGFFRDFLLPSIVNSVKSFMVEYHHIFWILLALGLILTATKRWLEHELIEHNQATRVVNDIAILLESHKAKHERYLRKSGVFAFSNNHHNHIDDDKDNEDGEMFSYMLIDQVEAKIFPRATESKEDYQMWQRVVELVERHSADNFFNNKRAHIVSKRFEINGEVVRAWEWVSPQK